MRARDTEAARRGCRQSDVNLAGFAVNLANSAANFSVTATDPGLATCLASCQRCAMRLLLGDGAHLRRFAVTHPTHPGPVSRPRARTFPTPLVQRHCVSANIRVRVGFGPGESLLLVGFGFN